MTLKNELIKRQRRWRRAIGYRVAEAKRRSGRLEDMRLRRFKYYQPALDKDLAPPVTVDEGLAKELAGEDLYPVFEGGRVSHYEDTVGEVVEELGMAVLQIVRQNSLTQEQAQAIRRELELFRSLAKKAYESAHRSDVLAEEAADLAQQAENLAFLSNARKDLEADKDPAPPPPPKQETERPPVPAKPKQPPLLVRSELQSEAAVIRARLAVAKAEEAKAHAQNAALISHEMKESLERLHRMVGDAALTSHGLPDSQDDAADALVAQAQSQYREAYAAATRTYRDVNTRLDRAFWVTRHAGEVLKEAQGQREAVDSQAEETEGLKATGEDLARARQEERRSAVGHAPSAVHRLTPLLFGQVNVPQDLQDKGSPLKVSFGKVPEPPAPNPPPKDTPGQPRPYQRDILQDLEGTGETESVLVTAPTGAGKTVILSRYIAGLRRQGKTAAVMAHTQELIDQAKNTIEKTTGEEVGLVQAGAVNWSRPVTVISHGTIADNPWAEIPESFKPDVMIIDEAHHAAAEGFRNIVRAANPGKLVGFTATPYRADGQDLDKHFQTTICRVETGDLVEAGYLVPPTVVDVKLKDQEGRPQEITEANNLPELYAKGIAHAKEQGRKKIIVFVAGGQTGRATDVVQATTNVLNTLGVKAGEVMGNTSAEDRERAVARFKRLREGVLINFGTLNEGFDAPSTDTIILGRNVGSPGTLAQIVGRGMRPDPANPSKTDVLVYNYSSRPSKEIRDLVMNQVQGNREKPVDCGPPSDAPAKAGGGRPAGRKVVKQIDQGRREELQEALSEAVSRAKSKVPAPSVRRVSPPAATGRPAQAQRQSRPKEKQSRRNHFPGSRGVPR